MNQIKNNKMEDKTLKEIANQLSKINEKFEKLIKTLKESRKLIENKPDVIQIGSTGDYNAENKSDK